MVKGPGPLKILFLSLDDSFSRKLQNNFRLPVFSFVRLRSCSEWPLNLDPATVVILDPTLFHSQVTKTFFEHYQESGLIGPLYITSATELAPTKWERNNPKSTRSLNYELIEREVEGIVSILSKLLEKRMPVSNTIMDLSKYRYDTVGRIIYPNAHMVYDPEKIVSLTPQEARLFERLAAKMKEIVSREILQQLLSQNNNANAGLLDVHVCALRKKLQDSGLNLRLVTVHGQGYRLTDLSADSASTADSASVVSLCRGSLHAPF